MKCRRFFSLFFSNFPFVREYRLRQKIRTRKVKTGSKIKKDEAQLKRYVVLSGTIRRL